MVITPMFFLDLFFPKFCFGCGMVGSYICLKCQKNLDYLKQNRCLYCQQPSLFGLTHSTCIEENGIDGSMAIFHYNNLLKKIVKNFKYRLAVAVWKEFCLLVSPERLSKINFYNRITKGQKTFLQPIPLHNKRLKERGFNQAQYVSIFFQRFINLPIADTLIRVKETKPQAQFYNQSLRLANMKNAFKIREGSNLRKTNFILIDDLLTSGNTVKAAAATLKQAGAGRIFVLTLAKG